MIYPTRKINLVFMIKNLKSIEISTMKETAGYPKFVLFALSILGLINLLCLSLKAQDFRGYQVSRYDGEALNTTFNKTAKVQLKILSIDGAGNVSAIFGDDSSMALPGSGNLTGKIDENGILRLTGPFLSWQISISGLTDGKVITANYKITGANNQEGRFTVRISLPEESSKPAYNPSPSLYSSCPGGQYEGRALNITYNQTGKVTLKFYKSNDAGNLTARFSASEGLTGDGTLTGSITEDVLRLTGKLSDLNMQIAARIEGDTITANYTLISGSSSQKGNFTVKCVEPGGTNFRPTSPDNRVANIPNNTQSTPPNQKFDNGKSINGSWKGTYTCLQGLTNAIFSVFTKDGTNVEGIFTFHVGDGENMTILGSGKYKGTYDNQTGKIEMKGTNWDQQPATYYLWDLSGTVTLSTQKMSGKVIGYACTTFQFEKIKF